MLAEAVMAESATIQSVVIATARSQNINLKGNNQVAATTAATINWHQGNNSTWQPHRKTFETKQSTIADNSCNNQLAATGKAVATSSDRNYRSNCH